MTPEPEERATILVVDDAAENLAIIAGLLKADYRVKAVKSGVKALEIAAASPPDVILLDVMMPELDGHEVCRRLKASEQTRSVPVIFLTAMDEAGDETRGFELGAADYIKKPFNPDVVRARVAHQVALQRERQRRRAVEEELRAARDLAEQANQYKSDFLAGMSHELRTPLSTIMGYSELIMEDIDDMSGDEVVGDLQKIHAAGKQLLEMVNEILDLAKIEAGRISLLAEDLTLGDVVHEACEMVEPLIGKNGNRLEKTVQPRLPAVRGDGMRLRQILLNLLSNAAKFTNGGTIRLGLGRTG